MWKCQDNFAEFYVLQHSLTIVFLFAYNPENQGIIR